MNEDLPEYLQNVLRYAALETPLYLVLLLFIPLDYMGYSPVQVRIALFSTLAVSSLLIGYATRADMKAKRIESCFHLTPLLWRLSLAHRSSLQIATFTRSSTHVECWNQWIKS